MKSAYVRPLSIILSIVLTLPNYSFANCLDLDGDGYGTRNGKPCRTRRTRISTPPKGDQLSIVSENVTEITNNSANINVEFSKSSRFKLRFGETKKLGKSGPYSGFVKKSAYRQKLSGLKPDTVYFYQITGRINRETIESPIKQFRTKSATTTTTSKPFKNSIPKLICPSSKINEPNLLVKWSDESPATVRNYDIFIDGVDTGPSIPNVTSTKLNVAPFILRTSNSFDLELRYFDNGDTSNINTAGICTISYEFSDDASERDRFWSEKGYTVAWSDTPTAQDYGKTASEYFSKSSNFANGQPIGQSYGEPDQISFEEFDGKPVMKSFLKAGGLVGLYVKAAQLGQSNTSKDVVYSQRVFIPSGYGQINSNGKSGVYIGHGHHWGSAPGVTTFPSGSRNRNDGWSVRAPLGRSNTHIIYYYPSLPSSTPGAGITKASKELPLFGEWMLMELEVISNSPASSSNGRINLYRNGTLIASETNIRLRTKDNVFPKGYGIFIRHNEFAPGDEISYFYDWKMYTRR